jgi:hypothetical protein
VVFVFLISQIAHFARRERHVARHDVELNRVAEVVGVEIDGASLHG